MNKKRHNAIIICTYSTELFSAGKHATFTLAVFSSSQETALLPWQPNNLPRRLTYLQGVTAVTGELHYFHPGNRTTSHRNMHIGLICNFTFN